jgi:xylulokinase
MAGTYIIASDLGSQSVKTAIYDPDGRSLGACSQDTTLHTLGPGAIVYYGDEFYKQTITNIQRVLKNSKVNPKDVRALSFTGMGGGIIGVDQRWQPTSEYTNPLDSRDQPYFMKMMSEYGDLIRSKSGTGSPMGANKIIWLKREHPEIYKNTKTFMLVTQYVQGRLAGTGPEKAFWENTSTPLSGLMDTAGFCWSEEICDALQIDREKLPRIVDTTEVVGELTRKAAKDCGLVAGIPIVAGAYDKPCDQLGSASNAVGSIIDNAATYPAITACVDEFTPDMQHRTLECNPSAIRGFWIVMTYITGGGLTHRWFRDTFCEKEKKEAEQSGRDAYSILDEKASKLPPGTEGLLFVPHLSGRATPSDPEVRGLWLGFTWTHHREHFYRSILEAVAYDNSWSLYTVKDNYPHIEFNQVRVLGGGAVSALWNQIKADVLGLPYVCLNREDFTILGAAIIGGKAVGLFDDMQGTAENFVRIQETIRPRPKPHMHYKKYVEVYSQFYKDLKNVYRRLSEIRGLSP